MLSYILTKHTSGHDCQSYCFPLGKMVTWYCLHALAFKNGYVTCYYIVHCSRLESDITVQVRMEPQPRFIFLRLFFFPHDWVHFWEGIHIMLDTAFWGRRKWTPRNDTAFPKNISIPKFSMDMGDIESFCLSVSLLFHEHKEFYAELKLELMSSPEKLP